VLVVASSVMFDLRSEQLDYLIFLVLEVLNRGQVSSQVCNPVGFEIQPGRVAFKGCRVRGEDQSAFICTQLQG